MRSQLDMPLNKTPHQSRAGRPGNPARVQATVSEETLVVDDRARIRPADMVEDKLVRILKEAALPTSQSRFKSLILRRPTT